MLQTVRNDRLFLALLVSLIAVAWLSLWLWGQSPYARFLDHDALTELTAEDLNLLVFFVAGWTLMIFAMFNNMVRDRSSHRRLVGLLILGYLAVWSGFGVLIHLADILVHEAAEQIAWLEANYWVLGAGTLFLAGVYQFTPLKYHCLDKCRSPFSFIAGRWSGGSEAAQAVRLGADHGVFCVGCCWSLMLLMFGVGAGNIGWMLMLGSVMALEKNMPWGRQLSKPLGVTLICCGAVVALGYSSWPN